MPRKRPAPLVPPPTKLPSRKRARKVTTLFHKLTCQRDEAVARNDVQAIEKLNEQLEQMGGRKEYQRASQVNTSFHSTSKWVLGHLSRNGWLYGIREEDGSSASTRNRSKTQQRRPTQILEVGAINTELLDAAEAKQDDNSSTTKYRLKVRAIDLHSMHPQIEQADFLTMDHELFDVIVCSMVINCITTPTQRGELLARLYHFVRPGGLVFLTLPKTCLQLSRYIDASYFEKLIKAVGLEIVETKSSPKIAFYICQRKIGSSSIKYDPKLSQVRVLHHGRKFRNDFAVLLTQESAMGSSLIPVSDLKAKDDDK